MVLHSRDTEPLHHIWGALKAHEVMSHFMKVDFQDDPSLNGLLTHFVFKHKVDLDGFKTNKMKLSTLTGQIKGLERDLKKKKDKE